MSPTLSRAGANAATANRRLALSAAIPSAAVPMKKMYGKTTRVSSTVRSSSPGRARYPPAKSSVSGRAKSTPSGGHDDERHERRAADAREEALRRLVPLLREPLGEHGHDGARDGALAQQRPERVGDGEGHPPRVGRVAVEERRERHVAHQAEHARRERARAHDARPCHEAPALALPLLRHVALRGLGHRRLTASAARGVGVVLGRGALGALAERRAGT